eukprot:3970271-Pyramimonas_sp.AAC.1
MPHGRGNRPRSQRMTESPVSARSGIGAISERDMLHAVLMVNADGQMDMRADEDTFVESAYYICTAPIHAWRVIYGLGL